MEPYRHFTIASYMFAYYAAKVSDDEIRRGVSQYLQHVPLKKVYLESHRGTVDVLAGPGRSVYLEIMR